MGECFDEVIPRSKSLCNSWIRTSLTIVFCGVDNQKEILWAHIKESYLNSVWSLSLIYSRIYFFGKWNRKFLKGKNHFFSGKLKDPGRCIIFLKLKIIFFKNPSCLRVSNSSAFISPMVMLLVY